MHKPPLGNLVSDVPTRLMCAVMINMALAQFEFGWNPQNKRLKQADLENYYE